MGSSTTCSIHGNVGRPRFEITREQMNFLVESGFTGPQIASIIGVSLSTVRRRMAYFGLSIGVQYTSIMDSELDDLCTRDKAVLSHVWKQAAARSFALAWIPSPAAMSEGLSKTSRS